VPAQPAWLADGDVVFLTGGLGGIGRALAQHLAAQRKVRLALLSREALPPRETWTETLARGDAKIAERVRWVQGLEKCSAEVLVVQGDVAERASLQVALAAVRARFGAIGVVIHAAGVMDDEPLLAKTDDKMLRVLAPKVLGAQNLDELVTEPVKAFVLMSSVASFLGLPGQIDYTAANAFLDAFAEDRQRRRPGRTIVVNWNAWRDVGMVLGIGRAGALPPLPAGRAAHPWLAAWEQTPAGRRYETDFAVASHWLLAEHRIEGGDALIPGTGFVELARAAFADAVPAVADGDGVELSQVTFLAPFQVAANASRRLQIDVAVHGDTAAIVMRSADGGETHMTADAKRCRCAPASVTFAAMRARCGRRVATRDRFLDQDFVRFGPRWQNLDEIAVGDGEAVVSLALDESFAADLGALAYHPALLDMATGAAQCLIPGFAPREHFLVPFGYDRIRVLAPVTRRCISHVRLRPGSTSDVASFDVRVFDETGHERIAIDGFTMKRVDQRAAITHKLPAVTASAAKANDAVAALLREAIATDEGLAAFDRILAQPELVQVVASSVDVDVWQKKLARDAKRGGDAGDSGTSFARPALSSDFVAPAAGVETQVAAIWAKLLGVAQLGATDDFFELGGSSLVAVRFFARIKKDFGLAMPLSTLFQAPTIRTFCNAMREQGYVDATPAGAAAPAPARTPAAAKSDGPAPPLLIRPGSGKLPLFFVHDGLGEVLLYRSLALLLDAGHAVFGLEPETANGRFLHLGVTDMARAKLERIRAVQPHGPYLLAGLCAGGVIAFEIARQLQELGERTLFVGIIDAADVAAATRDFHAQQRWSRVRAVFRPAPGESLLRHWLGVLPKLVKKAWNLAAYAVKSRLERARTQRTVEQLRTQQAGAAPTAPVLGFLELYENAHREHVPLGVFSGGEVALFLATQGNGNKDDVPFRELYTDALLGWQCRVAEPVRSIDVPGGHSSALQEPHVRVLAKELQARIDAALAGTAPDGAPDGADGAQDGAQAGMQDGARARASKAM
jgi:thioesterase domain-containing protein/NAD(P)-dependent dehydrogenase (short-subunit alcohol dehydrogenase family)/acyl carrier protein